MVQYTRSYFFATPRETLSFQKFSPNLVRRKATCSSFRRKFILNHQKQLIMERFILIFHGGQIDKLSPEEMQAHMGKWFAWVNKLRAANQYDSGEPLLPGGKLVSGKNGKNVTDGPYTEGKEVVGGYFIISAKDMDEAVNIAKECPDYEQGGSVQVRQVMKLDM
jgi:hypothetical protein